MHQSAAHAATLPGSRDDAALAGMRLAAGRRYWVCVGILICAAVGLQASASALGAYFRKEALPTKKPLNFFDAARLDSRFALAPDQPQPLPHDLVENLGTENYIQLALIDRGLNPTDPTYMAQVFISYYTGKPDMVPHNPKECMRAGGWLLKGESLISAEVDAGVSKRVSIPVSVLQFEPPQSSKMMFSLAPANAQHTVMYFFHTNGGYVTTRNEVRWKVANLADRYAYYSKIEISFSDKNGRPANREQAVAAVTPLLQAIMPVLWQDHYQDWDAIQSGQPPVKADR